MNPCRGPKARVTQRYRPPSPGSMSLSSRTAIADGRKKITIANTHSARLAGPIRPAVVSQRSPTIAVMLNSTTSRSVITRGSRLISGGGGMHRGHEPPDAATQRGGRGDVGGKVFVGSDAQRADPRGADEQQHAVAGGVPQLLVSRQNGVGGHRGEGKRGVAGGEGHAVVVTARRGGGVCRVEHRPAAMHEHLEPLRRRAGQ